VVRAVGAVVAAAAVLGTGSLAFGPAELAVDPILITPSSWAPDTSTRAGAAAAAATDEWLAAGRIPGRGTRWEDMSRRALSDLRELVRPNGAVLAGAADRWEYVWPRDSAFVAVALAETGHPEEAQRVLGFLDRLPLDPERGFEARYRPDGSGPPDDRGPQLDGCGWVLWALERVHAAGDRTLAGSFAGLQDRCTDHLLAVTDDGRRLPPDSPDYWEVSEWRTTLGTAAPVLAGLGHSADLYAARGLSQRVDRVRLAALRLAGVVHRHFGPEFERYGGHGGLDAAVAMLMPPFLPERHGVVAAWSRYQVDALRTAGGLAPGTSWKQDGVSWTPETALVAYTAAASGRGGTAAYWLDWLDDHRTPWGSLPEKVTARGRPAGPGPLAWTAALVVLALAEVDATPPPAAVPGA
jgi:GH15 family glucan-1,4-alpha-glucosidase